MISDREVIARIAQRMRKGKSSLTQEQAQKELIKIKERIDRKNGLHRISTLSNSASYRTT